MAGINWIENIPFFSIFLAMFASIITAFIKNGRLALRIHILMVAIVGAMSAVLLLYTIGTNDVFSFTMGHYPAPWGNELAAGPFEALMATTFSIVMFLAFVGGGDFVMKDVVEEKQAIYFVMLNALFGSMLALVYVNDIFTAYVFVEVNTITACAVVMAKGTARAMVGTLHYLVISLLGSGLFLLGVCILYAITGHLLFPQIKEAIIELMATGEYHFPLLVVSGFIFIGIAIKSGLFPFHLWMSEFYPRAPTASSAVLSGLVSKTYILLGVKLMFDVFTVEVMSQLKIVNVLFAFGLCGMIAGSIAAMKEPKMKKMLAFSSAAQIGYIYMGIGMGSQVGMTAACFHIIAHAFGKSLLFLCAGRFTKAEENKQKLRFMRGAALKNPIAGIGYTVGGLSMIGIPLFAGFISKIYFASASIGDPSRMLLVICVLGISMVLNALYFIPSIIAIWTPSITLADDIKELRQHMRKQIPISFDFAVLMLVSGTIALGIWYAPVIEIIEQGIILLAA